MSRDQNKQIPAGSQNRREDNGRSLEVGAQAIERLSSIGEAQDLITGTTESKHSRDGQGESGIQNQSELHETRIRKQNKKINSSLKANRQH